MTPATTPTNEATLEAVALIAVCKGSVALMELAVTLRLVAIGATEVPEEVRGSAVGGRIHRRLTNAAWLGAARAALGNVGLGRVAGCFRAACFEYAIPKTAEPLEDEDWLREVRSYYAVEENMRVLGGAILDLMRLPKVDVEVRPVPAARPRPVPVDPPVTPPQPAQAPAMNAPPAEWAIPIALIAIGKAERNPVWVSFGATVGSLSGFWEHERALAADPQFSVAAKTMLEAPRGFEIAMALLDDPALRAAAQAMMMRWHAITGGHVSSDGLRSVMDADAKLAAAVSMVLQATCAVVMAFVTPNPTPATKPGTAPLPGVSPAELPQRLPVEPTHVNVSPPELRLVPTREATIGPVRRQRESRRRQRAGERRARPPIRGELLPRGRSPPRRGARASGPPERDDWFRAATCDTEA